MVKRNPYREKRKRKPPPLSVQVAACLILLGFVDRRVAASMTTAAILDLVEWDHGHLHALEGSDHPSNFWPIRPGEHLEKSKLDAGIVAKHDRLLPREINHIVALARKSGKVIEDGDTVKVKGTEYTYVAPTKRKAKMASRGFQKGQRKMPSRKFQKQEKSLC